MWFHGCHGIHINMLKMLNILRISRLTSSWIIKYRQNNKQCQNPQQITHDILTIILKVRFIFHESMICPLIDNESYSTDTNGLSLSFFWCSVILSQSGIAQGLSECHTTEVQQTTVVSFVAINKDVKAEFKNQYRISRKKMAQKYSKKEQFEALWNSVQKKVTHSNISYSTLKIQCFLRGQQNIWGLQKTVFSVDSFSSGQFDLEIRHEQYRWEKYILIYREKVMFFWEKHSCIPLKNNDVMV